MKGKKEKIIKTLGILGGIIWVSTIMLRETSVMNNETIKWILGITPNIGAAWLIAIIVRDNYNRVTKKELTNKVSIIILIAIFILSLGSEVVHALFLNSPFDIFDIIATIIALISMASTVLLKEKC